MENTGIDAQDLREVLSSVAETMEREETSLNSLDAAIGDGDHGITMRVGFQAVKGRVSALPEGARIDVVLGEAGKAFMAATGGAIGVILGRMFMAGQATLKGRDRIGTGELRALLEAMESAIAAVGKAKPGDKTILDAVHAAGVSASLSESLGEGLPEALSKAATAAERAAQDTADVVCRVGRASRLGDRSLGHPDPGAVSFGIMLRAILQWLHQGSAGSSVRPRVD